MKRKLFYCYSIRLKNALCENGFHIITTGINPKTLGRYWIFVGSKLLNYYKNNLYQTERDNY